MCRLYTQTDFAWKCVQEYHGYPGLVDRMLTGVEENYRPSYKPRYPFLCSRRNIIREAGEVFELFLNPWWFSRLPVINM